MILECENIFYNTFISVQMKWITEGASSHVNIEAIKFYISFYYMT